jgi:hypothetical protein
MNEERPINLHFFVKEHALNFSKTCEKHDVKCSIRQDSTGYYVKTDHVTLDARRKLVADWAKVTIHEERQ